jgi:hypothetical protein
MSDDWMAEPSERDARRGYTRVSLATVNDDDVGRGGILRRTIMRNLDQCTADNDAEVVALIRQAEIAAIAAVRAARTAHDDRS